MIASRSSSLRTLVAAASSIFGRPPRGRTKTTPSTVMRDDARVAWSVERRGDNVVVTEGTRTVSLSLLKLLTLPSAEDRMGFIRQELARR